MSWTNVNDRSDSWIDDSLGVWILINGYWDDGGVWLDFPSIWLDFARDAWDDTADPVNGWIDPADAADVWSEKTDPTGTWSDA